MLECQVNIDFLMETWYNNAEMVKENKNTLDADIDTSWNEDEFWDTQTELSED